MSSFFESCWYFVTRKRSIAPDLASIPIEIVASSTPAANPRLGERKMAFRRWKKILVVSSY